MPALNAADHIAEALDSVVCQIGDQAEVEVILADGGSTDETLEIASGYSFVRILDGTDNGIYEGFNRGLQESRGDIIGILNADDCLAKNVINLIHQSFDQSDIEMLSGAINFGENCNTEHTNGTTRHNRQPLSIVGLLFGIPAINARFFRRSLVEKVGFFIPEAGIAADREFLLRIHKSGAKGKNLVQPLYHYRVHPGSTTIAGDSAARNRVWEAERYLADFLIAGDVLAEEEKIWAKRSRVLACLKQTVSGQLRQIGPLVGDLPHLPAALKAWKTWRARLSGY